MAKILKFISFVMVCISIQSTFADTFACTDDPEVCKTKFGTQFEKAFKDIHIPAIRNLFNTYIEEINSVKSELPPDHEFIKELDRSMNDVRKALQKLNDNLDDYKKIGEASQEGMQGFEMDIKGAPEGEEVLKLFKERNVMDKIVDILRKLGTRTGNLWAEMYAGLREKDLKAYPEYEEVNEHMKNLRGNGATPPSGKDYTMAARILASQFKLTYFEGNADIS